MQNEDNIDKEFEELEAELDKEENLKKENEPKPKPKPKKDIKSEPDIYPDFIENIYHNIEKMDCLSVLEKERTICFRIINYKRKIDKDYSFWEIKKKNINQKLKSITSLIEKGTWNSNLYKSKIKVQLDYEQNLLASAEKENDLAPSQKQTLKERINERINILVGELNQAEEQEDDQNKEDIDKESNELNKFFFDYSNNDGADKYPSTAEDIYHNIGKVVSLGVLEKEKELCDQIIEYKKGKSLDYQNWDTKKEKIDDKISSVTSLVQDGKWDLEIYKTKIKEEKNWDKKLLDLAENDTSLEEVQKKMVKLRIINRIKIINEELTKNPEEDE